MNYILCEGNPGNSDYKFCMNILEIYGVQGVIKSSTGNRGIIKEFNKLLNEFKPGDNFILFFDKVAEIDGVAVDSILAKIKYKCGKKNVKVWFTAYYCVEEVFLSYTGFQNLIDSLDDKEMDTNFKSIVREIAEHILNHSNYFLEMNNADILKYLENKNITTREECSKALCYQITPKLKVRFKITKEYIGDCWLKDCNEIPEKIYDNTKCKQCKFMCANKTAIEKLESLNKNSVAKYGYPFSILKTL